MGSYGERVMSDGGKGDKRRPGNNEAFDAGFDRIFGQRKVEKGSFVWDKDKGEFVPAAEFYGSKAESVAPLIMGDIQPYQSQVDGSLIQGRRQHREHLRQHRLIEIGNETKHLKPYGDYRSKKGEIKQALIDSVHMHKERNRK